MTWGPGHSCPHTDEGCNPAAITQTSPQNYQAWASRTSWIPSFTTQVAKLLAERYAATPTRPTGAIMAGLPGSPIRSRCTGDPMCWQNAATPKKATDLFAEARERIQEAEATTSLAEGLQHPFKRL